MNLKFSSNHHFRFQFVNFLLVLTFWESHLKLMKILCWYNITRLLVEIYKLNITIPICKMVPRIATNENDIFNLICVLYRLATFQLRITSQQLLQSVLSTCPTLLGGTRLSVSGRLSAQLLKGWPTRSWCTVETMVRSWWPSVLSSMLWKSSTC